MNSDSTIDLFVERISSHEGIDEFLDWLGMMNFS